MGQTVMEVFSLHHPEENWVSQRPDPDPDPDPVPDPDANPVPDPDPDSNPNLKNQV